MLSANHVSLLLTQFRDVTTKISRQYGEPNTASHISNLRHGNKLDNSSEWKEYRVRSDLITKL